MKIAISTISKNEEKNVEDFIKSCEGADLISVLDTGSTDKTVELLKKHNALAGETKIEPFRFDEARNQALDKLPEDIDIVISIDMDERLQAGWREALEKAWQENTETLSYWYIGSQTNGQPNECFRSKIFKRKGYKWFNIVHEMPMPEDKHEPIIAYCKDIVVIHLQEGKRDYEELLNKLIESGENDMNAYLQRAHEFMKKQEWQKAINDFEKYIELSRLESDKSQNKTCQKYVYEAGCRALAMIDISICKVSLGYAERVVLPIIIKATAECPTIREPWVYLAEMWQSIGNYPQAYGCAITALSINDNGLNIKIGMCWGDYPLQIAQNSLNKILELNKKVC